MKTEYNEDLHEYRIDGTQVPSVTTILRAAGLYKENYFSDDARNRGTYIHKAILYLIQDDLVEDSVPSEYLGYVNAFRRFISEVDIKIDISRCEVPLFSEAYRYGGTPDIVGIMNDMDVLLDVKTGIESTVAGIQTAAYEQLLCQHVKRYGLYLKAGGKYKLIPYTDRNDIKIFNAALTLYHWRQERKLL